MGASSNAKVIQPCAQTNVGNHHIGTGMVLTGVPRSCLTVEGPSISFQTAGERSCRRAILHTEYSNLVHRHRLPRSHSAGRPS
jgi:hypothetical protein